MKFGIEDTIIGCLLELSRKFLISNIGEVIQSRDFLVLGLLNVRCLQSSHGLLSAIAFLLSSFSLLPIVFFWIDLECPKSTS